MPTYQYACTECGHAFDQVQKFSDDALTACPVCQGKLRKVYNAVGVVFKGSGFYRNDSRSGSASDSAPSSDSSSSSSEKSSEKSSGSSDRPAEKSAPEKKTEKKAEKSTPSTPAT